MNAGAIAARLDSLLGEIGQAGLPAETAAQFEAYLDLLWRWNSRINLTAIRDEDGILRRHFVESIVCARAIPTEVRSLLDFGSGAGFPGIPIALCRPEIVVTLAESQGKKAAFLREAGRVLGISLHVHAGRAGSLATTFDCVTLRAVERMAGAVVEAVTLLAHRGSLALLTTWSDAPGLKAACGELAWEPPLELPGGDQRIFLLGRRQA